MKPYLRLSAELGAGEAAGATEPEPSPVFRPGCSYSGWLTRWVQQLLQHADAALRPRADGRAARPEQKSRAWLLLACRPCLRHDLGLAKCLLPYLLQVTVTVTLTLTLNLTLTLTLTLTSCCSGSSRPRCSRRRVQSP